LVAGGYGKAEISLLRCMAEWTGHMGNVKIPWLADVS
jgi:hypothetical protein